MDERTRRALDRRRSNAAGVIKDRRTRRNRSREAQTRKAINDSKE